MIASAFEHPTQPLLIVISGPSGAGKDSVIHRMKERCLPVHFVVTATTRPPRPGEAHGRDYFFVSTEEFEQMIAQGELLEHALVYNDYKGIPKQQIREALASGQDAIMRVDVQGAATVRALAPEAVLIFLTVASEEELVGRLNARRTETLEGLRVRLTTIEQEMQRLGEFDYCVVNRDGALDEAVDKVWAIIEAEHSRVHQRTVSL